ncbi:MAG: hypothetical protein EOP20_07575 [Hyphomicrobiales bacterium]|nr:MAG: hypothetical protein EOP20_07575 [Hyphomicrobiales bacterium]
MTFVIGQLGESIFLQSVENGEKRPIGRKCAHFIYRFQSAILAVPAIFGQCSGVSRLRHGQQKCARRRLAVAVSRRKWGEQRAPMPF